MTRTGPVRSRGFTLIELLLVLGIIGAVGGVILPRLTLSASSQINTAVRDLTTTLRSTYDAAVLTRRIHRVVIRPKSGEYWAEIAPLDYEGRPPLVAPENNREESAKAEARTKLLEELEKVASDVRKSKEDEKKQYSQRSILVTRRKVFAPIHWSEVDDPILFKRSLPGAVVFFSSVTEAVPEPLLHSAATDGDAAYVYFFPTGEAMRASFQLGVLGGDKQIDEQAPKYTVTLDSLSGQSEIAEGFQEPEFLKAHK